MTSPRVGMCTALKPYAHSDELPSYCLMERANQSTMLGQYHKDKLNFERPRLQNLAALDCYQDSAACDCYPLFNLYVACIYSVSTEEPQILSKPRLRFKNCGRAMRGSRL